MIYSTYLLTVNNANRERARITHWTRYVDKPSFKQS